MLPHILIIGTSSGIGNSLLELYLKEGNTVTATSSNRDFIREYKSLDNKPVLLYCDLLDLNSCNDFISQIVAKGRADFDIIIVTIGTIEPIDSISNVNFDHMRRSFEVNLFSPLKIVRDLIKIVPPSRSVTTIFFAGGGVNTAFSNHSAYSLSKIALLKAVEILDSEIDTHNFVCLGTGYVNTPIHKQSLEAGPIRSGKNYKKLLALLKTEGTPIPQIKECIDWCHVVGRDSVGGRNLDVRNRDWSTMDIIKFLQSDNDLLKLRIDRRGI
jgi:NAD(P)-dependent dehydrogenase (short-subunit alcohol dehydrogenase family)